MSRYTASVVEQAAGAWFASTLCFLSILFLNAAIAATPALSSVIPPPQSATERRFEFSQPHMGTLFRIVLYAGGAQAAQEASSAAFRRIAQLDQMMSDYRENSELMELCHHAGEGPLKVSEDLFNILAQSQALSKRSGGAFDITVGPVVQLWRRARRTGQMPDSQRLTQARKLVGYGNIRLNEAAQTVELLKKGMRLDLGAIAKGDAADKALAVLKQHGIHSALVAGGGDIALGTSPPGSQGWVVGIAPLRNPNKTPKRYLLLHDAAVSTSGDAEQHVEIDGVRYSHIIDPKTGMGITGRSSVTVTAPLGITSDSLATTVSVLGFKRGLELVDATVGAAALFVQDTGSDEESFESKRWKDVPNGNIETRNLKQD